VTQYASMIVNILVTPKAAAKHEILFNKPASALIKYSNANYHHNEFYNTGPGQTKKITHLGLFTHAI
jgi:hypothetical protein